MKKLILFSLLTVGGVFAKNVVPPKNAKPAHTLPMRRMSKAMEFQNEVGKIQQKLMGKFDQHDHMELRAAGQSTMKAALASKEFDEGVDKVRDGVEEIASAFASKIEVCKDTHNKLKSALDVANNDLNKLVRSNKVPNVPGESHIAQIFTALFKGLQKGFAKAKVSTRKCVKPAAPVTPAIIKSAPVIKK